MYVGLLVGTPFLVASDETVFGANHFALKESCQSRMILSQTYKEKDTTTVRKARQGYGSLPRENDLP